MTEHPRDPARPLRLALRANALFSSACALVFVLDSARVAAWTGAPAPLLVVLGLGLLGFAALLSATSRRGDPMRLRSEAQIYCAADLGWVAGSIPVVAMGWLTPTGQAALAAVSAVVLGLAVAQWLGIGALRAPSEA